MKNLIEKAHQNNNINININIIAPQTINHQTTINNPENSASKEEGKKFFQGVKDIDGKRPLAAGKNGRVRAVERQSEKKEENSEILIDRQ